MTQDRRQNDPLVHERLASMETKLDVHMENTTRLLQRHDDEIFGNGREGLTTRVTRNEQDLGQHRKRANWLFGIIGSVAATGLGAWFFG